MTAIDAGKAWDTYWTGAQSAEAFASEGASHPAIEQFWAERLVVFGQPERFVDLATGRGAVLDYAQTAWGALPQATSCVDVAPSAIDNVTRRFPAVAGVVANADALPHDDQSFDLVTTQFGVEYAGAAAFGEALRVVAPGGSLLALIHHQLGSIREQSETNLLAITQLLERRILQRFAERLRAASTGDTTGIGDLIADLERLLARHGQEVCDGTLARLRNDFERVYDDRHQLALDASVGWAETLAGELAAYRERMQSMVAAALSPRDFDRLCELVLESGFEISEARPMMVAGQRTPLCWQLVARRVGGEMA